MKNNILYLLVSILTITFNNSIAQSIAINHDGNAPNPNAILDIAADNMGILIPRMTTDRKNDFALSLTVAETGMLVFDTDENHFFFWQDDVFRKIDLSTGIVDNDMDTEIKVEENPDDDIIRFYTEGLERWTMEGNRIEPQNDQGLIFIGKEAGASNESRTNNIAIGDSSLLRNGIGANGAIEGNDNIGIGKKTLENNMTGAQNLAIGSYSLNSNLGNANTALGYNTLNSNTEGDANTAVGHNSLQLNRTGANNVGVGVNALQQNSSGSNNIAIGSNALSEHGAISNSIAIGTDASRENTVSGTIGIGDSTLMVNGYDATQPHHGAWITAIGYQALSNNTIGWHNTAIGYRTLTENTIGTFNTAVGSNALRDNISGGYNIAIGVGALRNNTVANANSALGYSALETNLDGFANTAVGYRALTYNEDGVRNVGIGSGALVFNSSGDRNVAVGASALFRNTVGYANIAIGNAALNNNTTADGHVAIGDSTLHNYEANDPGIIAIGHKSQIANYTGRGNTSVGALTLYENISGNNNTAIGSLALYQSRGDNTTAVGYRALYSTSSGDENTAVGSQALSGNISRHRRTAIGYSANSINDFGNNTGLGNDADCTAPHQVRIGNDAVTSIGGYANWTNISDGNFKKNVQEDVVGIDFIRQLRPVTYQLDMDEIHQFYLREYGEDKRVRYLDKSEAGTMTRSGFIAQEVESSAKSLGYDFSGVDAPKNDKDYYGLRYAEFVVPLVKAVQEQQDMIEKLKRRLEKMDRELVAMRDGS